MDGRRARRHLEPRRGRDGDARGRPGRGRRARLRLGAHHAASRRLVADEDRQRRGRRRARRGQHVRVPRRRRLAPLAGPPRPAVRAAVLAVGAGRARLGGRPAALVRRHPVDPDRGLRAAGRLLEHLPVAARRGRARRAARRPAARVGAGRRPARPRRPRAPRPVRGQVDVLDGLVLPGPWRPGARPRGVRAARVALGRVRRARARHPLRRHQPVGDRRRDLRARDGASTRSATTVAR